MRDAFSLDPDIVYLNHGSYGAVPRVVWQAQRRVRELAEANPMRFFRIEQPGRVNEARHVAAGLLDVEPEELALVKNATEAVSTTLAALQRSGRFGPGDVVLVNDHGYGAVKLCAELWCERYGVALHVVALPLVFTDDEAVDLHREAISHAEAQGLRVALVVIDAITSPTGIALPVRALARLTHEHGAMSFVDAAHGPGHQDVSPASTGADFWVGTFHKWAFAPRGAAAFWVTESMRDDVEPVTTGWSRDEVFPRNFDFRGTDDYSAWLSLGAAVGFWRDIGGFDAVEKRSSFLDEMAALLRQVVSPASAGLPVRCAPCLRLVPLPDGVASTEEAADELYAELSGRKIESQVIAWGGRGFIRLSAAPYNQADDYERLAQVLPTCQALVRP